MGKTSKLFPTGRFLLRTSKTPDMQQAYPIFLYYYCNGKQIRGNVGFTAKIADWNKKQVNYALRMALIIRSEMTIFINW